MTCSPLESTAVQSNRCQSSDRRRLIKTELMPHKAQNRVTCASMAPPRCGALDRSARLKRNSGRDLLGIACVCVQTAVGLDGVHF